MPFKRGVESSILSAPSPRALLGRLPRLSHFESMRSGPPSSATIGRGLPARQAIGWPRCMGQRRRYTTVSRSVKSVCRSSFSLPLVRHRKGPCGRLLRAGLPLVDNPLPVVIADDDPDIREMVRTALQLDGFHVLEASNGQTAWELILARRPVVVLADVRIPGIGGLELTARIKAHGYHETKVILFTGGMG